MLKVKAPFAESQLFAPLFRSTRPAAEKPLTVPPTVKVLVMQVTATLVTLALPSTRAAGDRAGLARLLAGCTVTA